MKILTSLLTLSVLLPSTAIYSEELLPIDLTSSESSTIQQPINLDADLNKNTINEQLAFWWILWPKPKPEPAPTRPSPEDEGTVDPSGDNDSDDDDDNDHDAPIEPDGFRSYFG